MSRRCRRRKKHGPRSTRRSPSGWRTGSAPDASMDEERAEHTARCLRRLTGTIAQIFLVSHKRPAQAVAAALGFNGDNTARRRRCRQDTRLGRPFLEKQGPSRGDRILPAGGPAEIQGGV